MGIDPSNEEVSRAVRDVLSDKPVPPNLQIDVYKKGNTWHIDLDLPGVDVESIELTAESNVLRVQTQRHSGASGADQVIIAGRPQGEITQRLVISEQLDVEHVVATYHQGVLQIEAPTATPEQKRKASTIKVRDQPPQALTPGTDFDDGRNDYQPPPSKTPHPTELPQGPHLQG